MVSTHQGAKSGSKNEWKDYANIIGMLDFHCPQQTLLDTLLRYVEAQAKLRQTSVHLSRVDVDNSEYINRLIHSSKVF